MKPLRNIPGVLGFLVLAAAALSCETSTKVLWVRVDCSDFTISCVDDFEMTFRPTGSTQIHGRSNGTWAGGDIRYSTETREGVPMFVVTASGNWIRDQVMANADKYPGFIFELPMKNVGSAGTFELRGSWRYQGVTTGEARHPTGGLLILPDEDGLFTITVFRLTNDLCLSNPPDSETDAEVVEAVDPSEDWVEDSVEPSEEVDETAEPDGPDAPDSIDDEAGEEGGTDESP